MYIYIELIIVIYDMYIIVYIYICIFDLWLIFLHICCFFKRLSGDPLPREIFLEDDILGFTFGRGRKFLVEPDTPWIYHLVMTNIAMERSTTFNR